VDLEQPKEKPASTCKTRDFLRLRTFISASENPDGDDVRRILQRGIIVVLLVPVLSMPCSGQGGQAGQDPRETAFRLEQQGDTANAVAAWQAVLKAQPGDSEAYAHLGFLEARQEHYKQAVPLYKKALALNPSMPGLRLNLGLAEFKSGELKGAIQTFEILLKSESESSPERMRIVTLLGLAHFGLGEYAAAVPYLKQATGSDPQNLPFRMALAQSCLWSKQYQCVLDVYQEIVTLNPDSAEADMLAGQAYDELKNDAGALEQFRAAVKADPKMPNVHFGYGYLLWRQMKFEEADEEFKAELANMPDHAQALAFLGDSEMHLGHPDAAIPSLKHALRIDPAISMAHLDLGIIHADQGQKDEALRELLEAARLSPQDQNVHWRLGRFYQSVGNKVEAKAEFDKTRSLQKASDQSVFERLHQAQQKGKPENETVDPPGSRQ
jgi:tetratricopeptide (TPR) repeat protein